MKTKPVLHSAPLSTRSAGHPLNQDKQADASESRRACNSADSTHPHRHDDDHLAVTLQT